MASLSFSSLKRTTSGPSSSPPVSPKVVSPPPKLLKKQSDSKGGSKNPIATLTEISKRTNNPFSFTEIADGKSRNSPLLATTKNNITDLSEVDGLLALSTPRLNGSSTPTSAKEPSSPASTSSSSLVNGFFASPTATPQGSPRPPGAKIVSTQSWRNSLKVDVGRPGLASTTPNDDRPAGTAPTPAFTPSTSTLLETTSVNINTSSSSYDTFDTLPSPTTVGGLFSPTPSVNTTTLPSLSRATSLSSLKSNNLAGLSGLAAPTMLPPSLSGVGGPSGLPDLDSPKMLTNLPSDNFTSSDFPLSPIIQLTSNAQTNSYDLFDDYSAASRLPSYNPSDKIKSEPKSDDKSMIRGAPFSLNGLDFKLPSSVSTVGGSSSLSTLPTIPVPSTALAGSVASSTIVQRRTRVAVGANGVNAGINGTHAMNGMNGLNTLMAASTSASDLEMTLSIGNGTHANINGHATHSSVPPARLNTLNFPAYLPGGPPSSSLRVPDEGGTVLQPTLHGHKRMSPFNHDYSATSSAVSSNHAQSHATAEFSLYGGAADASNAILPSVKTEGGDEEEDPEEDEPLAPETVELVRRLASGGSAGAGGHAGGQNTRSKRASAARKPQRFEQDIVGDALDEELDEGDEGDEGDEHEDDNDGEFGSNGRKQPKKSRTDKDGAYHEEANDDGLGGYPKLARKKLHSNAVPVYSAVESNKPLTVAIPPATGRARGRPSLVSLVNNHGSAVSTMNGNEAATTLATLPKRRGRPPKYLKDMEHDERKMKMEDDDDGDYVDGMRGHHPPTREPVTIPGQRPPVHIYTKQERRMRLDRYRDKLKNRKHPGKRVIYRCRKDFADQRPRQGGRFIKKTPEEKAAHEAEKQRKKDEKKQARLDKKRAKEEQKEAERVAKRTKTSRSKKADRG